MESWIHICPFRNSEILKTMEILKIMEILVATLLKNKGQRTILPLDIGLEINNLKCF